MAEKRAKDDGPKDIGELCELYYKGNNFEARKRYECRTVVPILTDAFEHSIQIRVNFPIEKIPEEAGIRTPDFISLDRKTIIESTSSILPPNFGETIDSEESEKWRSGTKRIDKINEAVNHAVEKDYGYLQRKYSYDKETGTYLLFVAVDVLIAGLFGFYDGLEDAVKSSTFLNSGLSGIVFITESGGLVRRAAFLRKGSSMDVKEASVVYIE